MARSYVAYAGSYDIDEEVQIVTHNLELGLDPYMVTHPPVRHVSFDDEGHLILSATDEATGTTGFLQWKRA